MTPDDPETAGSEEAMNNLLAFANRSIELGQPRRYAIRRLHDVGGLTQAQIADLLDVSQPTVQRDLAQTVPPAGRTPAGTVFYPPKRFAEDEGFKARVAELEREIGPNAKIIATEEFAGPPVSQRVPIRTTEQQRELRERAIKAAAR